MLILCKLLSGLFEDCADLSLFIRDHRDLEMFLAGAKLPVHLYSFWHRNLVSEPQFC